MPRLNYSVTVPQKTTEDKKAEGLDNFKAKSKTKLSMQAVVSGALLDKLPNGQTQETISQPANPVGWGKNV